MEYMQQYVKEQGDTSLCNVNKVEKGTTTLNEDQGEVPTVEEDRDTEKESDHPEHPSHAAEGVRWKGGRKVAVMRQEQLGVSSSGAKDLPQGLAVGYDREQRPDAALDVLAAGTAQAREEHKTLQQ